ncbi:MAG: hypothetical protein R6W31_17800, partial [Bacteroidales bacterium]
MRHRQTFCFLLFALHFLVARECSPVKSHEKRGVPAESAFDFLKEGDSLLNSGDLFNALIVYDEGINAASGSGLDSLEAAMVLKQGKIYLKIGDIDSWKGYERKFLDLSGRTYFPILQLDYLKTSFQVDKGLKLARIQNDSLYIASFLIYKARMAGARGDADSARYFFGESESFLREEDKLNNFHYHAYMAEFLTRTGDLEEAGSILDELGPLVGEFTDLEVEKHYWSLKAAYHDASGEKQLWIGASRIRDSLQYTQTNTEAVVTLSAYQRRIMEVENQATIEYLRKRQLYILLIVGMLLLAGIIFTLLFFKIRRQNLMLKQSDEYKLKILRILTHDLRGPLVALTHKLERDHQDEAGKQVSRILQTSDELLEWTFHELQSGQMELGDLDPAEVIEEVLANVNRIIPAGKELILFEPLPEEIAVRGNPEILKFVLRNIVNNALKFSEGSIIKVTLLR